MPGVCSLERVVHLVAHRNFRPCGLQSSLGTYLETWSLAWRSDCCCDILKDDACGSMTVKISRKLKNDIKRWKRGSINDNNNNFSVRQQCTIPQSGKQFLQSSTGGELLLRGHDCESVACGMVLSQKISHVHRYSGTMASY